MGNLYIINITVINDGTKKQNILSEIFLLIKILFFVASLKK